MDEQHCDCRFLAVDYKRARREDNRMIQEVGSMSPDRATAKRVEDAWNKYAAAREACPLRGTHPHY
jgi:hypothetical protein